jgi:hypothetical protein
MQPTLTKPSKMTRVRTKSVFPCTHSRMIDDVRSTKGAKTGQLVCMECQAEFPDQTSQHPTS